MMQQLIRLSIAFVIGVMVCFVPASVESKSRSSPRDVIDLTTNDMSCVALRNGTAWCWSPGGKASQVLTNIGIPLTGIKAIETNSEYWSYEYHTCAIAGRGSNVWCWGDNSYGQLGDKSYTDRTWAVVVYKSGGGLLSNITKVVAGQRHTCALDTKKEVWCWGSNYDGQLGIRSTISSVNVATKVRTANGAILRGVTSIVATYINTCALNNKREVWCWGNGGQCIIWCSSSWYPKDEYSAVKHPYARGVSRIDGGYGNMCALMGAYVRCWGSNGSGQLGIWSTTSTNYPSYARMGDGQYLARGITDVSVGDGVICVVRYTSVYCAGSNSGKAAGGGLDWYGDCYWCESQLAFLPLRNSDGTDMIDSVISIDSGDGTSCLMKRDGSVWCWGYVGGYGGGSDKPIRVQYEDGRYIGS